MQWVALAGLSFTLLSAASASATDYDAVARRLDERRAELHAPSGATVYQFGQQRLRSQPGGENRSLDSTLLQAPGVSIGGNGGIRVRGQ